MRIYIFFNDIRANVVQLSEMNERMIAQRETISGDVCWYDYMDTSSVAWHGKVIRTVGPVQASLASVVHKGTLHTSRDMRRSQLISPMSDPFFFCRP
jgi:hypothetical protein